MIKNQLLKVLIALDYDPTAQKVAETGYRIAKSMSADVILLHVVSTAVYYSSTEFSPIMGFTGYSDFNNSFEMSSIELIDASHIFLEKTRQHLGDNTINILIREGDLAEAILSAAATEKADYIVLGSHSRKWLENLVMGSVTENVLNKSKIPLFIIPTKKHS